MWKVLRHTGFDFSQRPFDVITWMVVGLRDNEKLRSEVVGCHIHSNSSKSSQSEIICEIWSIHDIHLQMIVVMGS